MKLSSRRQSARFENVCSECTSSNAAGQLSVNQSVSEKLLAVSGEGVHGCAGLWAVARVLQ